jgi:uncharacterized OB-fold protein
MTQLVKEYTRPTPIASPDDKLFWEGCKEHKLLIERCVNCGAVRFWDKPMCPTCNSLESEPVAASGRGTIWSYTTTYHAFTPPWKGQTPYTVVIVSLEEGPRITSVLEGTDEKDIEIGAPVEVFFDDITPDAALPKFRIVR